MELIIGILLGAYSTISCGIFLEFLKDDYRNTKCSIGEKVFVLGCLSFCWGWILLTRNIPRVIDKRLERLDRLNKSKDE